MIFFCDVCCQSFVPMHTDFLMFKKKGIDGYFYHDQLARLKFRVFHMLLEICEYGWDSSLFQLGGGTLGSVGRVAPPPPREHTSAAPWRFHVVLGGNLNMVGRLWWALSIIALSLTHVSVSVANNFVRPQSSADYGYYAFGEVSHFVYCLLQKIKQHSVLPLVEKWEEYMTPNHSKFAALEEDRFLAGTRVSSALEKVGSTYLKKEFRRDCRKFLGTS